MELLSARQIAARNRVERELANDPDHYKKLGRAGGQKKVPKGTAKLSKKKKTEIGKAGASARHTGTKVSGPAQ